MSTSNRIISSMSNSIAASSSSASSSFGFERTLTDREAETYDRQIRLWGVDGQKRLLASNILVSGMGACGAEATKNIVLAGTRVTLHDIRLVEASDLGAQYFLTASDIGNNVSEKHQLESIVLRFGFALMAGCVSRKGLHLVWILSMSPSLSPSHCVTSHCSALSPAYPAFVT